MERKAVELIWQLNGVREFVEEGLVVAELSGCIFYAPFLKKKVHLRLQWCNGQLMIYVVASYDGGLSDEVRTSVVWEAYWLINSMPKDINLKRDITDSIVIATKQEILQNVSRDPLTVRVRLRLKRVGRPSTVHLVASSKCGLRRSFVCAVNRFSSLNEERRRFILSKVQEEDEEMHLEFFLRDGHMYMRFLPSSSFACYMLMEAIFVVKKCDGEKGMHWTGKQALKRFDELLLLRQNKLILLGNNLIPDDSLTLSFICVDYTNGSLCYAVEEERVVPQGACIPNTTNQATSQCSCVDAGTPILSDLLSLLQKETLSDFVLRCGSESFPVHRALLCARSPVFEAMLTAPMLEAGQGAADLPDFRPDTVRRLVRFLYTDSVPDLGPNSALELYSAADKYAVLALRNRCSDVLASGLSTQSVLPVLSLAERHGDPDLKEKCVEYIMGHEREVFVSPQWAALRGEDDSLALQLTHDLYMKKLSM